MVLIVCVLKKVRLWACGFRPLTGIMVLFSIPYVWRNYAMDFAFYGADFIFPLFSEFSVKRAIKNS